MKTFNDGDNVRLVDNWEIVCDNIRNKRMAVHARACGGSADILEFLGNTTNDLVVHSTDSDGDILLTQGTIIYADCLELVTMSDDSEEHY